MKKSITVPKNEIIFIIVLLIVTFVGIEYVYYIKNIEGYGYYVLPFFPLIVAIRFSRLLIAEMKKK